MRAPASSHTYTKSYKSVSKQIDLLESRGMEVTDRSAASACLERIGYYRLSGYWYPFRRSHVSTNTLTGQPLLNPRTGRNQIIIEDDFRDETTFRQVMDMYVFDKRLRLLILDAIERIEVALRVDIALLLGARDPWAHRDPRQLHGNFTTKVNPRTGRTNYEDWLQRLDETFDRSKEEFVKHFKTKYRGEKPPIWIAIELWDFGMLSVFLSGLNFADQTQLALKYGLSRTDLLTSWCRNINNVRNICAHHSRLWNRSPADQIAPPKPGEIGLLDHIATNTVARSRVYASVAVIQFFIKTIHPGSSWATRLKEHCAGFPRAAGVNLAQAGFPSGWEALQLWN